MKKPKKRNEKVLIVDDEFLIQELLSILIEHMGLKICGIAETADRAIELAQAHRPAIVLMDMRLKGEKDGVDAAIEIHNSVGAKIIYITGSREPKTLTRIERGYPTAVLFKPFADSQLRTAVDAALGGISDGEK